MKGGRVSAPSGLNKEYIRKLHEEAVRHQIENGKAALASQETKLIEKFANGNDVIPERISPRLIEVNSDKPEGRLFRYATLHWSIPIFTGYGRRLRFLVVDEQNDKLIGVIGLADPVFKSSFYKSACFAFVEMLKRVSR